MCMLLGHCPLKCQAPGSDIMLGCRHLVCGLLKKIPVSDLPSTG